MMKNLSGNDGRSKRTAKAYLVASDVLLFGICECNYMACDCCHQSATQSYRKCLRGQERNLVIYSVVFDVDVFPSARISQCNYFCPPDVLRWQEVHPKESILWRALWEIVVAKKDLSQNGRRSTQVQDPRQPECLQQNDLGPPNSRSKQDLDKRECPGNVSSKSDST